MNICSLIYIGLLLLNWITGVLLVLFMHRSPTGTLVPLDLEIEATLRRNRAERRRKLLQDRTVASIFEEEIHFSDTSSPDSPSSRESATQLPEAAIMADEHHQRITLEDYSSSSISQFNKRR